MRLGLKMLPSHRKKSPKYNVFLISDACRFLYREPGAGFAECSGVPWDGDPRPGTEPREMHVATTQMRICS